MQTLEKLYKIDSVGRLREWTIHINEDSFHAVKGLVGMKLTQDKPTTATAKNIGRSNETSDGEQAELEAKAKWDKKLKEGYALTPEDAEDKKYFDPMLAQSYDDRKSDIEQILDVGGIIYSQPKLDGIRCIIRKEDDKLVARTRKGRTIDSIPHIIKSLEPYFIDDKSLVLDGELYNHELNHDFNKIVSLVRKQTPTKSKSDTDKSFQKKLDKYKDSMVESEKLVQYHVYDIPKSDIFRRRHLFSERFFAIDIFDNEYIKMVHTKVASSFGDLDEHYKNYLSEGYEGQMIRINSGYDQGKRSAKLLKRKDFMDAEYQVVDISEGNGNRTGTAKHIVCYCEKTDQRFNSNIKGNFDYLAEILNNREEYIGKQATIKFFELTPDGVPRFPYAIAFRDYE
jgi:DNA ligase-1